jgi:hypothetical protein
MTRITPPKRGVNIYESCIGRTEDLAGGSLLRSGQTQVGEPKIEKHAQWHYFESVTQTLRK